jgi:dethiobiotin synthetase
VGKTTIAAAIVLNMKRKGLNVGIMKPFATASTEPSSKNKSADAAILADIANVKERNANINPFFSSLPTAPYTASLIIKSDKVDIIKAVRSYSTLSSMHDRMIVEGIGGILVPLTRTKNLADFAKAINLPVIVVARFQLGMINHILLTLRVCLDYGLKVGGIILNDLSCWKSPIKKKVIVETIEKITRVSVLAQIPYVENGSPEKVAQIFESCLRSKGSSFRY